MNGELLAKINHALDDDSWHGSVVGVKRVMGEAIRALDRTAEVESTGYFNHSFVPDYRVSWEEGSVPDREVFLRLDSSAEFIEGDLKLLDQGTAPIFIGLSPLEEGDSAALSDAVREAEEPSLVTDPLAVQDLEPRPGEAFSRVLPSAFLRGGQGIVSDADAIQMATSAADLFRAARVHDPAEVSQSATALAEHLRGAQHSAMLSFSRVVWEATGGDPASFPGQTDLTGRLSIDGLRFLLTEGPPEDLDFWRSVGRSLTLEKLLAAGSGGAPNLGIAVAANLDRILVRYLAVSPDQISLDQDEGLQWHAGPKTLELRGSDFRASFSLLRPDEIPPDDHEHRRYLTINEFRSRVSDLRVQGVSLTTSIGRTVTIEGTDPVDVQTDPVLNALDADTSARVRKATVLVGGKNLELLFPARTATGRTTAQFELAELLQKALGALWDLAPTDAESIAALTATSKRLWSDPTLFDFIDG